MLVSIAACGEPSGCEDTPSPPAERGARPAPASTGPRTEAARRAEAGAASPAALLSSAREALASDDYEVLLASIWPETRESWLLDLVVDLAVESTDHGAEPDWRRREARAEVRAILARHGATISSRPEGLSPSTLGKELLGRVPDQVALYADLLRFAGRARAPFDPTRALTGSAEPSVSATPLLRLVDRLRSGAEIETRDGGVMDVPSDGPFAVFLVGQGGPGVLRMRAKDAAYWLDES